MLFRSEPTPAPAVTAASVPAAAQQDDLDDAEEAGEVKVHLSVKDAELPAILKLLAEQYRLNIIAGKDVSGRVTADFYGITVDEALKAILEMNGYAYVREGDFIKVYTREQLQSLERAQAKIMTRVFRLNYVNVDEAKELIRPALSKTAQISTSSRANEGIPSGGSNVGGDSYSLTDKLVIRDFEENIMECERLLKEIDIRPQQVMVEATILAVTLNDETSVGVDFNMLAGVDFRGITTAAYSVANPNAAIAAGATAAASAIPFGRVGTSGFAPPGTGLNVGVITNDVSLFIRALETVEDVNVLSNPKIMALNKQRAEVLVGNRLGYRTTTLTQTTAVETVEFLDTGTQLRFRPFISSDGFIRMEIHPEVSTGSISATDLPSQQTTEVTCNIIVRDGHTVVIGGLFEETTRIDKSRVPLLGSIPILGVLFRNESNRTLRREIVILLTPHILNHDQANADGQEILERIERQVTGLRSAFPFYTREKLTQIHLIEADKYCTRYLQSGCPSDRSMAVWNLKLARNVAPNNLEVIKRLELMEAETALQRPRLQNESILWRRMSSSGMLDKLPALPEETDVEAAATIEPAAAVPAAVKPAVVEEAAVIEVSRVETWAAIELVMTAVKAAVEMEVVETATEAVEVEVEIAADAGTETTTASDLVAAECASDSERRQSPAAADESAADSDSWKSMRVVHDSPVTFLGQQGKIAVAAGLEIPMAAAYGQAAGGPGHGAVTFSSAGSDVMLLMPLGMHA